LESCIAEAILELGERVITAPTVTIGGCGCGWKRQRISEIYKEIEGLPGGEGVGDKHELQMGRDPTGLETEISP
jgi:hypothetical protein